MTALRLGISTCPNDTFAFHGILERKVDLRGLDFAIELADVQRLNERLARGELDAGKASFHAALALGDRFAVLPVGAALGYGHGPLLLAAAAGDHPSRARADGGRARVLAPGNDTTATLLYRLFHRDEGVVEQTTFDRILPALTQRRADFGVCIHEARFTYREHGLHLVEDLGERWEEETAAPLPLGGILASHALGASVISRLVAVISDSLAYAHHHRDDALRSMRRYAQELDDAVLWQHVDLYVSAETTALSAQGRVALADLAALAGVAPLTIAS
jgi:1,4-dihydroxy-6-naphthoate synthase